MAKIRSKTVGYCVAHRCGKTAKTAPNSHKLYFTFPFKASRMLMGKKLIGEDKTGENKKLPYRGCSLPPSNGNVKYSTKQLKACKS